jgi:hypothetical protein
MKPGTVIRQGRADAVIPFADSEELVKNSGPRAPALIEVGNDPDWLTRSRRRGC